MKKIFISLCFLSAIYSYAQIDRSVQPISSPAPEINIQIPQRFELSNGLKVFVIENHKLPKVSISVSMDNPLPEVEGDIAGTRSIMGSMLGNGTKTISKDAFNEEIDYLGARLSFSPESAYLFALSRYFPRVLELMADAMIQPRFDKKEFYKERDRYIDGLKASSKDVSTISSRVKKALVYGANHSYGEFTTEKSLKNIRLGDIITEYYTRFVPTNAYMVIIGDVDFKKVKKLVKKNFKSWRERRVVEHTFPVAINVPSTEIDVVNVPNAVQTKISVVNTVDFRVSDPDYLAAKVANNILGSTEGYLFQNLREDKGYTYGAYSHLGNDKRARATFEAYASVRTQVVDSAIVEFLKEINKIRKDTIDEQLLKDTKAKFSGKFIMSMEKPTTMARIAINLETKNLPDDFYSTYLERVADITVPQVGRAAQKYFSPNKSRILVVGNAAEIKDRLENITFDGQRLTVNYFDKYANPIIIIGGAKVPEDITVESILNKYIKAIGGDKRLRSIFSVLNKSKADMNGNKISMLIKKYKGEKSLVNLSMFGNSISKQVYDGKKGFAVTQGQWKEMTGELLEKFKESMPLFVELNLLDNGNGTAELVGIEEMDDTRAYVIKIGERKLFYDANSGLKIREEIILEVDGQRISQEMDYDNYKEHDGVLFPNSITLKSGSSPKLEFIVDEVSFNMGVDPNIDFK